MTDEQFLEHIKGFSTRAILLHCMEEMMMHQMPIDYVEKWSPQARVELSFESLERLIELAKKGMK